METIDSAFAGSPILQQHEFNWIKDFLYKQTGIVLNENKKALVTGRLDSRLRFYGLGSYTAYFHLFSKPGFEQEKTMAIDLLTTNETYFFREIKHFDFLQNTVFPAQSLGKTLRIWSAASSSGEEAYSCAMLLANYSKNLLWEIIGSDISTRMVEKAQKGLYPLLATDKIPPHLLKNYCLKGKGEYEGFFLVEPNIRKRVKFMQVNLLENLPDLGLFDVIFLRNVMIYFDAPTKKQLVERMQDYLKVGGYFIISHSESLTGFKHDLLMISPSIYQKK